MPRERAPHPHRMRDKISARQLMVLKFWDRGDLSKKSRKEISDWINQWHSVPRHRAAWTWWKLENEGTTNPDYHESTNDVTTGASANYLSRLAGANEGPGTWFSLLAKGAEEVENAFMSFVDFNTHIDDDERLQKLPKGTRSKLLRQTFFNVAPPLDAFVR